MSNDFIRWTGSEIVKTLVRLKDNRGAMSDLRAGLIEAREHKAWPYIAQWCNIQNYRTRVITTTIAAMYALHQNHVDNYGNFGKSLRRLALSKNTGTNMSDAIQSYTRHINRIVSCSDSIELCKRLPFYSRMMKNEGIPIDYSALYSDVVYWNKHSHLAWVTEFISGKEDHNVSDEDSNQ